MYVLLLISKYLRRKMAPLFACVGVVLCTAMVIVVMSVMGGFLNLLRDAAHRLSGDVIVMGGSISGFEHYEDLIERLEATGEVAVATPVIDVPGLVKIGTRSIPVAQVVGIEPGGYDAVVGYSATMHWGDADWVAEHDCRFGPTEGQSAADLAERAAKAAGGFERFGAALEVPESWRWVGVDREAAGAMVPGIEVSPYSGRDAAGQYDFGRSVLNWNREIVLTVLPVTQAGGISDVTTRSFVAVNEFKSGLYEVDANRVYVPLGVLQEMLSMDAATLVDEETFEPVGESPARVTEVLVKSAEGVGLAEAKAAVDAVVAEWEAERGVSVFTLTWEERHGTLLNAVENEKGLVTFLFVGISVVAVFMVFITFYMIVRAQTRDIGTLRAIGASRVGVLGLFVGYGLAIGLLGAGLGTAGGCWVVVNLNEVQGFLAERLGVTSALVGPTVGGAALGGLIATLIGFVRQAMRWWLVRLVPIGAAVGLVPSVVAVLAVPGWAAWLNGTIRFVMWNPQTYYFDRIPSEIDVAAVAMVAAGAVVSSTIGAVIPALVASASDPVEALRHE
ncbi:MAG: FtsX-like permease family protein [Planctomycetota bacterium]